MTKKDYAFAVRHSIFVIVSTFDIRNSSFEMASSPAHNVFKYSISSRFCSLESLVP